MHVKDIKYFCASLWFSQILGFSTVFIIIEPSCLLNMHFLLNRLWTRIVSFIADVQIYSDLSQFEVILVRVGSEEKKADSFHPSSGWLLWQPDAGFV